MVEVDADTRVGLNPQGGKAAGDTCTDRGHTRSSSRPVKWQRLVNRKHTLVGNRVFDKDKRPVHAPFQHSSSRAKRTAVVHVVVTAAADVGETPRDTAVGVVAQRSRVGCQSAEYSSRHPV